MRKSIRPRLRVLAKVAGVGLLLGVLCLDGVDHQPYFRTPYYAETMAGLRAETNRVMRGELAAGFGRVRLSPEVNVAEDQPAQGRFRSLPLAGYGGRRGKPATGVHDELYVKAVVFKVGDQLEVVVGADALILPREVADLAVQRLGTLFHLGRDQIYFGATHSHSSLGGWGEGVVAEQFAGGYQPAVRAWFADCLVGAVREALADLRPAEVGQGQFAAPGFVRNRLVGELGRVDPEFAFTLVRQAVGRSAVLGVFGAHATVLSEEMMEFSADYPGCWARAVEQATGGVALFLAGGVGSQSPVPGTNGFAGAERMGQALAQQVIEHLARTPLTNTVTFARLGLEVVLPPLNMRLSDGIRLRPWLARRILHTRARSYLQAFRLEDAVWISAPCDFSGELALGLKDFARARGARAVVTSFNGDYIGYVIPARYYHLSGYEPRLMSFFGPNVPDYLEELMRRMTLKVLDQP